MEQYKKYGDEGSLFNPGWFALGFFLGLIGVIIALLINDEKRNGRIKWTLIGWGGWIILLLIILAASGGSSY
ncbi:MAG: hypothetical protein ABJA79_05070 [Parafilimonas sp.]